ncbi:phage baseplate protein [Lactococcus petauri]|uniref:phage baseplate protein n=1 Tax=Lactococcus petauri TaxID=1940789 RepID=UPI0022E01B07|nr:phage baseplate protein [Lactococcus petauri]
MTQYSFPWNDVNGDRLYDAEDFMRFFAAFLKTGVVMSFKEGLRVRSAQNGMNIQAGGGSAVIDGGSYMNDETIAIQVNVASSVQNRTDSVVLRMDKNARNTYLYYKPSDTTVVRNDVIFELQLATISVKMNAAQITDADITDMRSDSTVCGWSTPFDNINVDGIVDQYKGIFERADIDFQSWFQNLKNQLDDNQASNLQNQIDTINGIIVQKDIPEGANLDDYRIEGEFSKKTPTIVTGAPEGITGAFRLSVRTMLGSSGIFQTLYDYVTRSMYYRIGNTTLGFNIPWQKVKTDIDDIPWTTIPGSNNRADYKKVGEIVLIRWSFTSGGNYDISLGTLPEGCRPLNRTYTTAYLTGTTPTINGIQINAATGGNPGLITLFGAKTGNAFSGQYAFSIG